MLNWDEYGNEENTTPPAAAPKEAVKVTPEPQEKQLEQVVMDTSAPENTSSKVIEEGSRAQIAREAIKNLDEAAGIEELDEMMGSRVQVDDKMMINCNADLNQLVPFK